MGELLVREVLDFAPDALTTPERMALVKLAADTDDLTRRSVLAREYADDRAILAELVRKGVVIVASLGTLNTDDDMLEIPPLVYDLAQNLYREYHRIV